MNLDDLLDYVQYVSAWDYDAHVTVARGELFRDVRFLHISVDSYDYTQWYVDVNNREVGVFPTLADAQRAAIAEARRQFAAARDALDALERDI